MPPQSLIDVLGARLSASARSVMAAAVREAEGYREAIYLVGGSVRDLLLGRPNVDLDLALEGDAISLGRHLAERRQARLVVHKRFGTASLRGDGWAIDLARVRSESYKRPGALPTVRPASLADDLARRDFTVNAMALPLSGPAKGKLLDPYGGREDLERGRLRVLHDRSFQDDATRTLRAVRYEVRLSFRLVPSTVRILKRDLSYLETISGARLRRELALILAEDEPETVLRRCEALGVLPALHPALAFDRATAAAFVRARERKLAPPIETYFCLLTAAATGEAVGSFIQRLSLPSRTAEALKCSLRLRSLVPELDEPNLPPSRASRLLEPLSPSAVAAFALVAPHSPARQRAERYLREWRYARPSLKGGDLLELGIPQGPEIGALLERLRAYRLDGRVGSRREEVSVVLARRAELSRQAAPVGVKSPRRGER
jgi:tRNA nucleotidyltransferase (CCA-adding enzyme)